MKKAHKLKNSGASRFSNPDNDGGEGGSLPSFAAVNVRSASVHVLQPSHIPPGRKLQQPAADHHCFFVWRARGRQKERRYYGRLKAAQNAATMASAYQVRTLIESPRGTCPWSVPRDNPSQSHGSPVPRVLVSTLSSSAVVLLVQEREDAKMQALRDMYGLDRLTGGPAAAAASTVAPVVKRIGRCPKCRRMATCTCDG